MTPVFVLAVLLKGLLVLSLALGLSLLFRRASAAVRHGVWVTAFVALLALPVLEAVGPTWAVPFGPAPVVVEPAVLPEAPAPPAPPAPPAVSEGGVIALERHAGRLERHAERLAARAEREAARFEREVEREAARFEREAVHFEAVSHAGSHTIVIASDPGSIVRTIRSVPREAVLAALWFWAMGALAVALAWGVAYAAAAHAVRRGTPETDEDRLATWERVRLLSDLDRRVRLLRSPGLDVPIAWGWGEAAVVLPASADDWDDDRLEAVLLHEVAHLLRRDARSQLLAQVALVLHWANPLAWLAYRRFLLEREHACDDVVLEHGARPSAYADHLVQVARDLRRRSAALAAVAPMARRSNLEGRVVSILDPQTRRSRLGRATRIALAAVLAAFVLPLAALTPVAAQPPTPIAEAAPLAEPSESVAPEPVVVPDLDLITEPLADAGLGVDLDAVAVDGLTSPSLQAHPTAGQATPRDVRLALDTIPRFDDVVRPALERALQAVEAMRSSQRHRALGLTDDDWKDVEESIRESIEDARHDYDEALNEAIEDAIEARNGEGWSAYDVDVRSAEVAQRRLREARAEAERSLARVEREVEQSAERQREAQRQAQRQLERSRREVERAAERARRDAERDRQRAQASAYAFSTSDRGTTSVAAVGGGTFEVWTKSLDGLEHGIDGIERAIDEVEASGEAPVPGLASGLRGGLSGIAGGLSGIEGSLRSAARTDAERRSVARRIDAMRARIRSLQRRVDDR